MICGERMVDVTEGIAFTREKNLTLMSLGAALMVTTG